ncbi:NAD-dependent deacylase [Myxococcus sp. K15C18031901]|uniref:SIR2 family NAD-dependent protein deacylase n=1 Tax=Myxococcus dinghuensis TaxID=2906761 RepID=UPI0020A785B7|nr:NAD-dependent deacylase [Myxococcus dinghuensis]MCP3101591.1 NAD-dependent deacylase [Myxococcus dinghuensis]
MERLILDADTWLLVLTGAGVSAESGIATFRGMGGLWENHPVEDVASPQGFIKDPLLVWRFYSERRAAAASVQPNPGHHALADWERHLGNRFLLATQNVDGLHLSAGSQRVVEMHGNLFKSRCTHCEREPFADTTVYATGTLPLCGQCGEMLRPHIVWFGEYLEPADLERIESFVHTALDHGGKLVFLSAGTSGAVYPAAGLVNKVTAAGGDTWSVNLEAAENSHRFKHFVQGKSGEVLPALADLR